MIIEVVSASRLKVGDAIHIDGQVGWWTVDKTFEEGIGGPIDIDLRNEDDEFGYNWHVSPNHKIERRVPQQRP